MKRHKENLQTDISKRSTHRNQTKPHKKIKFRLQIITEKVAETFHKLTKYNK